MLRLVEHYASVQGEGPRTGTLTQFVRFAGCNMRCPGWPCDTVHAIDPSIWRKNSYKSEGLALASKVTTLALETGAYNICLTGGEPFLQDKSDLYDAINPLLHEGHRYTFEAFTNGSFYLPAWAFDPSTDMLIMLDWKLKGSGEHDTSRLIRVENAQKLKPEDGVKFVVTDYKDLLEAVSVTKDLKRLGVKAQFWVAPAWGRIEEAKIVDFMMEYKVCWRLNAQLHKYIWDPTLQGV